MGYSIEPISDSYRGFVDAQVAESWSGPFVESMGVLHDTRTQNGFVAIENNEVKGYLLYNIIGEDFEITVLESLLQGHGIGTALINAAIGAAKEAGCGRVWLTTSNDNTHAIRFYQRFGFDLKAVHINSLEEARKRKPQIPLFGNDGIPIKHEFEFTMPIKEERE